MTILVCTDGQPHSEAAILRAISLAQSHSMPVIALYVIDSWLKQFSSEIYAQGRQQYLDYVDACLESEADDARRRFDTLCAARSVDGRFVIRHGDPLQVVPGELEKIAPGRIVFGDKRLAIWGRVLSRKLPERVKFAIAKQTVRPQVEQVARKA